MVLDDLTYLEKYALALVGGGGYTLVNNTKAKFVSKDVIISLPKNIKDIYTEGGIYEQCKTRGINEGEM